MAISGMNTGYPTSFYPPAPRMPGAPAYAPLPAYPQNSFSQPGRPMLQSPGWQPPMTTMAPPPVSIPYGASLQNSTAMTPPQTQWSPPPANAWQMMPQGGASMMPYGPQGMPGAMTWMPVIRTVAPPVAAPVPTEKPAAEAGISSIPSGEPRKPASEAVPVTEKATASLEEVLGETPPKKTVKTEGPAKPLSPAEQTGKKVGDFVTQVLQDNPQLQEKVDQLDFNSMMANPESFANRFRESFQRSRLFRMMPRWLDRRVASMFPRDMEPMAEEVIRWLRTESTGNTGRAGKSWMSSETSAREEEAPAKRNLLGFKKKAKPESATAASQDQISELLRSLGGAPA